MRSYKRCCKCVCGWSDLQHHKNATECKSNNFDAKAVGGLDAPDEPNRDLLLVSMQTPKLPQQLDERSLPVAVCDGRVKRKRWVLLGERRYPSRCCPVGHKVTLVENKDELLVRLFRLHVAVVAKKHGATAAQVGNHVSPNAINVGVVDGVNTKLRTHEWTVLPVLMCVAGEYKENSIRHKEGVVVDRRTRTPRRRRRAGGVRDITHSSMCFDRVPMGSLASSTCTTTSDESITL